MTRVTRTIGVVLSLLAATVRAEPISSTVMSMPTPSATVPSDTTPTSMVPTPSGVVDVSSTQLHASAPSSTAAFSYSEIVVSASRPVSVSDDLPSSISVVSAKEFPPVGGETTGSVLAGNGVSGFRSYSGGSLQTIQLRGYEADPTDPDVAKVGILFDGREAGEVNVGKMPAEGLDRIEVIRGAGSALFGSSAMGGVINLVPRRGTGEPTGELALEGGDWSHRSGRLSYGGQTGALDYFATADRLTEGAFTVPGLATVQLAARNEWNGLFNLGFSPWEGQRIGVSGYGFFGDHLKNPGSLTYPDDPNNMYRKRFQTGQAQYTGRMGAINWDQTVYMSGSQEAILTYFSGSPSSDLHTATQTQGGKHLVTYDADGYGAFTTGIEWTRHTTDSFDLLNAPYQPQGQTRSTAWMGELRAGWPGVPVKLTAGLREDWIGVRAEQPSQGLAIPRFNPATRDWTALTARGGAVYEQEDWRAYASVGTGFRAPAPHELAADYTDPFSGNLYTGNSALKPEHSLTSEIGAGWHVRVAKASLTVFRTQYTDKIQPVATGPTSISFLNLDGAELEGLEWEASTRLPTNRAAAEVFCNGTYHVRMHDDDATERLREGTAVTLYVPRWFGAAGLRLGHDEARRNAWSSVLSVSAYGTQLQQDFNAYPATAIVAIRPFAVWSASVSYRLTDEAKLYANVENFMNERYQYILDYPMPGSTAVVGLAVTF